MPRASYRVPDHQSFAEWPPIMGAGGADREHLATAAGEEACSSPTCPISIAPSVRSPSEIPFLRVGLVGLAGLRHMTLRQWRMPRGRALAGQQLLQDHGIGIDKSSDIAHFLNGIDRFVKRLGKLLHAFPF
jgi:hypothetical protein